MIDSEVLFVIPARKHSERFPGKNLALFQDEPLFAASVRFAQQQIASHTPKGRVVITSDDEQVKAWAAKEGVVFIDRPAALANATASSLKVLQHTLEVEASCDWVVLLQPTNPLRPAGIWPQAMETLQEHGADSLFTVSTMDKKLGRIAAGRFEPWNYDFGQRSQDMEPLYFENGLLYVASPAKVLGGALMDASSVPMIVDHPYAAVDIDYPRDLEYATYIARTYEAT